MFSISLKRVYYVCDNIIIRTLRNRRLGPNPGLDKRSRVLGKEEINSEDGLEDIADGTEGNFFEVGKAYKDHIIESQQRKESLRHQIVQQKYFKESTPNLLTWSEKEQIRYLHSSEPDEWTPERIAESFPVTASVAKKLLKYPWKPASVERICRHDASAMNNWLKLNEGELDIPLELREHFLKFSKRKIPPLDKKSIKIDITPDEELGEFQSIIDSCAKHEKTNKQDNDNTEAYIPKTKDQRTPKDKRITLEELTNKIKKRMDSGNEVQIPDQMIVQNTFEREKTITLSTDFNEIEIHQEDKDLATFSKKMREVVKVKEYPQRIRIPKKAWKKGGTYKVDDCYYDDDGRFLYRVLGAQN